MYIVRGGYEDLATDGQRQLVAHGRQCHRSEVLQRAAYQLLLLQIKPCAEDDG